MNTPYRADPLLERRLSMRLIDVFIRACLILVLAILCYDIFSPFVSLMSWALILAVSLYPLHVMLARRLGGRDGLAAILIVLLGLVLIVAPTTVLAMALGESVQGFVDRLGDHSLQVPAPPESVAAWPVVGTKVHALWAQAHNDLQALFVTLQPHLGDLPKKMLGAAAAFGGSVLMFLFAFVVAGIMMAWGREGARGLGAVFDRIVGIDRGGRLQRLCTSTIRAVAQGVLGVALIQAIVIGLLLLFAGIPFAGVLAVVVLVLGIAQLPALLVTLPVIVWIWWSGSYATGMAILHTVLLGLAGTLDNILKPLLLGRGVEAPMPVILLGALGGMATGGILGMFVGATFLALGYQIFMSWVDANPDLEPVPGQVPGQVPVPLPAQPAALERQPLA
jgi:predicted PurR-regulated permease PerM